MAPQVGLESPRQRNFNNLDGSRWHKLLVFRCGDLRAAREWHGDNTEAGPNSYVDFSTNCMVEKRDQKEAGGLTSLLQRPACRKMGLEILFAAVAGSEPSTSKSAIETIQVGHVAALGCA